MTSITYLTTKKYQFFFIHIIRSKKDSTVKTEYFEEELKNQTTIFF